MKKLKNIRQYLLDMDGTIYLDNELFDGTTEFLNYVKNSGGRCIFMTNNSSKSVEKYIEKLASMGIKADRDDFLTSLDATAEYLKKQSYKKPDRKTPGPASSRNIPSGKAPACR